jgi:hypothetical protein
MPVPQTATACGRATGPPRPSGGEGGFRIEVAGHAIDFARGETDCPDARIDTDPGTLAGVLWGGLSLAGAQRAGEGRSTATGRP